MTAPPLTEKIRPRLHLAFLDGIRGIAALYVFLHHAAMILLLTLARAYPDSTPNFLREGLKQLFYALLVHGHYAVVVFIVLSGFCLMIPIARIGRAGREAPFELSRFFMRRSRRILPPYYAALLISLLVCALPGLNSPTGFSNDVQLPAFTVGAVGTHLTLLHNLFPEFAAKINAPLWSVALEWQIYFVFALILIPLWRRFGTTTAVVASIALGVLPSRLTPTDAVVSWGSSWLLTAFGFGMGAAALCFGEGANAVRWRERRFWMPAATVLGLALAAFLLLQRQRFETNPTFRFTQLSVNHLGWLFDLIVAGWTALLILACVQWLRERGPSLEPVRRPLALRLFESRPAVALGAFSYSLYLIHSPLLALGDLLIRQIAPNGSVAVAAFVLLVPPFTLIGAYLLYYLVERRCLNAPK